MKMLLIFSALLFTLIFENSVHGESTLAETEKFQCGNIFTDATFILTTENYPFSYPTDNECFYLLKGHNCTFQYNLEFLDFDIKASVGCTDDRLEVGHQDALCGFKNGSKIYKAENGSLKLKFISGNNPNNSRGFKMLVKRIDSCDPNSLNIGTNITFENRNTPAITTETSQIEWASQVPHSKPTYLPPAATHCCQNNIFSSKKFLLVSPNFPFSGKTPQDCIYVIKRASSQVCRLRINILFFSLGPPTQNSCPNGHLEIDGKYICGCNLNLKLTTDFRNSDRKVLNFHSSGYNSNDFYGFVLEVVQDECPKKYSPDGGLVAERTLGNFRFYDDQSNTVLWPQTPTIKQLKLVNERSHWTPPQNNIHTHYYFFAPEEEKDISWTQPHQDKEETNYVEISTINTLLSNLYNYQQCLVWNKNQIGLLNRRYGSNIDQMCRSIKNDEVSDCTVLGQVYGYLQSPGYPLVYPANQRNCYRFQLLPGYCAVRIYFNDFQIERSYDCLKDYLAINQYRYCGNYLQNKHVTINTKDKSHQDLNFITDANYCAKGFSAQYQQVSCQKTDPITPVNCNPGEETTSTPINCNEIIREKSFVIRKAPRANFCTFKIKKYAENICKVNLYFEHFNLPCNSDFLTIDGKVYCGQMTGHSLTLDILDEKTLIYKSNRLDSLLDTGHDGHFIILGTQISENCETNIPEPERLTWETSKTNSVFSDVKQNIIPNDSEICQLLKNNVTTELPNKICELLNKHKNVSDCNGSKSNFIDLSTNKKGITQIRLRNNLTEQLNYKIIECKD